MASKGRARAAAKGGSAKRRKPAAGEIRDDRGRITQGVTGMPDYSFYTELSVRQPSRALVQAGAGWCRGLTHHG